MCLSTVYRGKEKRKALAKLPESGYYWKYAGIRYGKYYPIFGKGDYESGWNKTKLRKLYMEYATGFHLYRNKKDAENWRREHLYNYRVIIRCKVEKKDIKTIGEQAGLCIVTTRFWCPKPK